VAHQLATAGHPTTAAGGARPQCHASTPVAGELTVARSCTRAPLPGHGRTPLARARRCFHVQKLTGASASTPSTSPPWSPMG
jgi:hypothetical protein